MRLYLEENQISYNLLKGDTRDRDVQLRSFRDDPSKQVFLCSLKAGGLGIDLTAASVVIHYDRWWNAAREDQATDRVHRLGQKRGVQVLKLITRQTLEERIDIIIDHKATLADKIMDTTKEAESLDREALIELLQIVPQN
jgi:SNF2 family DNA or RNA helicase